MPLFFSPCVPREDNGVLIDLLMWTIRPALLLSHAPVQRGRRARATRGAFCQQAVVFYWCSCGFRSPVCFSSLLQPVRRGVFGGTGKVGMTATRERADRHRNTPTVKKVPRADTRVTVKPLFSLRLYISVVLAGSACTPIKEERF